MKSSLRISIFTAILCSMAIAAITLSSCGKNKFKISGQITEAAADSLLLLETTSPSGEWFAIDSVRLSDSGKFSFSAPAPSDPEILRLSYSGQYIYLPIDSIEHIEVKANGKAFSTDFTLTGSEKAAQMEQFEKQLHAAHPYLNIPDSAAAFKRRVYSQYIKDSQASVVSYYVLTKTIDGHALYDSADDYKYFAAVATSYKQYRPNDPRTAMLESISMDAMRRHNSEKGNQRVLEAEETAIVEIVLPGTDGNPVALSQTLGEGKPTVVVFSNASGEASKEMMRLRGLYNKGGINIYHVAFDAGMPEWRNAALNLPWTTVWAGDAASAQKVTRDYNVSTLPTYFIYDRQGQLAARAENFEALAASLGNY